MKYAEVKLIVAYDDMSGIPEAILQLVKLLDCCIIQSECTELDLTEVNIDDM